MTENMFGLSVAEKVILYHYAKYHLNTKVIHP